MPGYPDGPIIRRPCGSAGRYTWTYGYYRQTGVVTEGTYPFVQHVTEVSSGIYSPSGYLIIEDPGSLIPNANALRHALYTTIDHYTGIAFVRSTDPQPATSPSSVPIATSAYGNDDPSSGVVFSINGEMALAADAHQYDAGGNVVPYSDNTAFYPTHYPEQSPYPARENIWTLDAEATGSWSADAPAGVYGMNLSPAPSNSTLLYHFAYSFVEGGVLTNAYVNYQYETGTDGEAPNIILALDWKVRETAITLDSGASGSFHIDMLPAANMPTGGIGVVNFVVSSDRDSPQMDLAYYAAHPGTPVPTLNSMDTSAATSIEVMIAPVRLAAGEGAITYKLKVEDASPLNALLYDDGPQYITVTVVPPIAPPLGSAGSIVTRQVRLLAPLMAADSVTGRLYLALGMCDYLENWLVNDAGSGLVRLSANATTKVTPHPVIVCVSAQEGPGADKAVLLPWVKGVDCGAPIPAWNPPNGWLGGAYGAIDPPVILPFALQPISQEGLLRVTVGSYGLNNGLFCVRESSDLGATWNDGLVSNVDSALLYTDYYRSPMNAFNYDTSSPQCWLGGERNFIAALNDLEMSAAYRGQHPLSPDPRVADIPSALFGVRSSVLHGASGFAWSHSAFICIQNFPTYIARGAAGPYSAIKGPYLALQANGQAITTDGGATIAAMASPSVGAVDDTLTAVPNYPFPNGHYEGVFSDGTDGMFTAANYNIGGLPYENPIVIGWPRGCNVLAAGSDMDASAYLFAPAAMHPPIPRASFTWSGDIEDGFCQDTDAETDSTGRDFGRKTCILVTHTGDGGLTWGDLGAVVVDGEALIADTSDVRIAAARLRSGRLMLCVCTGGVATLYASDDGAGSFFSLGSSRDGGLTWRAA